MDEVIKNLAKEEISPYSPDYPVVMLKDGIEGALGVVGLAIVGAVGKIIRKK